MPSSSAGSATNRGKHRITTPVVLQTHVAECGAACLGSVLGYFGRWVPLSELREKCEVSRDGSSAASLLRAARHYGLECRGLSAPTNLLKKLPLPLILYWQYSHFVVLEGFDEKHFYLNDPAVGKRTLSIEEVEKSHSGVALQFGVGKDFAPGGERPALLRQVNTWLQNARGALFATAACGLMLALLTLIVPTSVSIFVDTVLANQAPWGGLVMALLGGGVLVYLLSLLKQRFLKRLAIRLSVIGSNNSVTRLLRLPMDFFAHRMAGDLADRVSSIDKIAKNLTEQLLVLMLEIVMSAVFLLAMLAYDVLLTVIVLLLAVGNGALAHYVKVLSSDRYQEMRREQGMLLGVGLQMLNQAENLRVNATDDLFFARWSGQQAREREARVKHSELGDINLALPGLTAALRAAAILGVGASQVVAGELTLGSLAAVYILAEAFLAPVGRFVEFTDKRQALETDIQRLEDISRTTEDPLFSRRKTPTKSIPTFKGRLQLAGQVEMRNITFGYNKSRPPLIKDFNLIIKPGQRVALVGSSGSGKSTLSRLVSGIYQPWSGEILFDGHHRHEIPEEVLRRSISMVDQEIVLFSASIRDNITLWNPAVPDDSIVAAARDACIHEEILQRPLDYATPVEEGGVNFSGGQRQRLEIARALVGNPTFLILDEATSALDALTEELVDDALRRRGVTCMIVAHRLSTVRDCDEIIVLDRGTEAQRGTHDKLIKDQDGIYYKLVSAA